MIKYYGVFDDAGLPRAFYNDDVYTDGVGIPKEAVEITQDQWRTFINNPTKKKWNGNDVVDYVHIATDSELFSYASDVKKAYETGGITINGYPVATDRPSQAMITQTVMSLTINPNLVLDWKNPDGSFTTLTADFIKSIAYFVSLHVSNTFTALRVATGKIEDGSLASKDDIDSYFKTNIITTFSTPNS